MGVIQLVNYGAAFVVLILLTRTLSVEAYGVVAFSVGIVQVGSIVLDLGFTLSATQRVSEMRDDPQRVSRLAGAVLGAKLIAALVGTVGILVYAGLTTKYAAYAVVLALSGLPLIGHALQPLWLFSGIEQMRYVTAFVVTAKLLFLAIVSVVVRGDGDCLWVPLADGIAQLSAAGLALSLVSRTGYSISRPESGDVKDALEMTRGFFASRIAATASGYSGVVVLALVAPPSAVALYALPEQLYRAMHAVFSPIVTALYPYMTRERDFALLARVAAGSAAVAVTGALVGHFLAPIFLPAVFGAKWEPALPILDIFLIAIGVHVMTMMATYPLSAAMGRTDVANSAVIAGAIVYVAAVGALLIIDSVTPAALAWLMVVSEGYVLLHCLIAFREKLRAQGPVGSAP